MSPGLSGVLVVHLVAGQVVVRGQKLLQDFRSSRQVFGFVDFDRWPSERNKTSFGKKSEKVSSFRFSVTG